MIKRLAIVPARGGSKRIHRKNIKDFCGKPMIGHILATARESGLFQAIHVSTEDEEICNAVEEMGFRIDFRRPAELADDHTPLLPVLRYVVNKYLELGNRFDQVWLLMACSPLIEAGDLRSAAVQFEKQANGRRAVLAVSEYPSPIEWAFTMDDDGNLSPLQVNTHSIRSQDLEKKYYDSGCFVAFPADHILHPESHEMWKEFSGYILPKYKGIDIDSEDDWHFAELVFNARNQLLNR